LCREADQRHSDRGASNRYLSSFEQREATFSPVGPLHGFSCSAVASCFASPLSAAEFGQYLPFPAIQKSAKTSRSSLRQLNTGRPRAGVKGLFKRQRP